MDLLSISPIDGRYKQLTKDLQEYFSEYALIKYRVFVEIMYFLEIMLKVPKLKGLIEEEDANRIINIFQNFELADAERIKEIEKTTNHDVKAVEYFVKEKIEKIGLGQYKEYVHFGLTSQDINSSANILQIERYITSIFDLELVTLLAKIKGMAHEYKDITILSRTHGQAATSTSLGKELMVYHYRLEKELEYLRNTEFSTKFGGAVGNLNAHEVAIPDINWIEFADKFVDFLGLKRNKYTTQIDNYDNYAKIFDNVRRINTILVDFNQDMWLYISNNIFKQKIVKGEVGSSTMPHKVNPINFENSEGNLKLANTLFDFFSNKLPVSRLQRDLTDSTVLRNVGVAFAHTVIGIKSTLKGLNKVEPNLEFIQKELEDNWVVVAEAVQTVLRHHGYSNCYEKLKEFTRGGKITKTNMDKFINNLDVDDDIKNELLKITPFNYIGVYPDF